VKGKLCRSFILAGLFTFVALAGVTRAATLDLSKAAGTPEGLIHAAIEQGLAVLSDKNLNQAQRREKIRTIMLEAADMNQMAALSLSKYKSKFTPEQFQQFTDLFSKLVFNTYIGHVESYNGEPVQYGKTQKIAADRVRVPLTVMTKDAPVPGEFSLYKKGTEWKVYDVRIEGISLVNNYRSQFNEFLVNKTPSALIDQLKHQVSENASK